MARSSRGDPLDALARSRPSALDAAANPFSAGAGAIPPAFGGRDEVLEAGRVDLSTLARGRPAAGRALEGLRGTGKTALMARVRRAARDLGLGTAHLEADRGKAPYAIAVGELRDAVGHLLTVGRRTARRLGTLRSLKLAPTGVEIAWAGREDEHLVEALVLDAARVAEHRGTGFFMTLDEAHEAEEALLKPVLRALHRADQDGLPASGWFAGLPGTAQRLIAQGQTYAERIAVFELGMLDRDAVADAIARPFAAAGVSVEPAVLTRVHRESGGYPFFVQAWGEALWAACSDARQLRARDAAQAAPAARSRADDLMRSRWQRLTEQARAYTRAMAILGGDGPWRTGEVAAAMGRRASSASPARAALLASGAAAASGHGLIGFTVPGFAAWVRRHQP